MILASWLHDLDPFALEISRGVGLRWYGLAYGMGFLVGWLLLTWMARRGAVRIPPDRTIDVVIAVAFGVVLGGRLGYVLVYNRPLIWTFTPDFPFWGLLDVTRGGMASHGGIAGVVIVAYLLSRGSKDQADNRVGAVPMRHYLDIFALLCTPGLFFGRIANFINGELLGKVVAGPGTPGPWWAVRFPQEVTERWGELPDEQQRNVYTLLRSLTDKPLINPDDTFAAAFYQTYEGLVRRLQHGSEEAAQILGPLINARHPSQFYQAFAEGLLLGVVLLLIWRRPRRPGVIGSWFMIVYGVGRILTEFFRLPDSHLENPRPSGLSLGQWLSVLMILVGVTALTLILRRDEAPIGGWGRRAGEDRP